MRQTTKAKREALRTSLVDLAEEAIAAQGLPGLQMRSLAKSAGCSLGSIYLVFADADALVLAVNLRTLERLADAIGANDPDPTTALESMARGYLGFARRERGLWSALFAHRLPEGALLPVWYADAVAALFACVEDPIARILSETGRDDDVAALARTLFSAVHGIVALGLDEKLGTLPYETLEAQVSGFVRLFVAGLSQAACGSTSGAR